MDKEVKDELDRVEHDLAKLQEQEKALSAGLTAINSILLETVRRVKHIEEILSK